MNAERSVTAILVTWFVAVAAWAVVGVRWSQEGPRHELELDTIFASPPMLADATPGCRRVSAYPCDHCDSVAVLYLCARGDR